MEITKDARRRKRSGFALDGILRDVVLPCQKVKLDECSKPMDELPQIQKATKNALRNTNNKFKSASNENVAINKDRKSIWSNRIVNKKVGETNQRKILHGQKRLTATNCIFCCSRQLLPHRETAAYEPTSRGFQENS